jgi:hypothetical protein
MLQSKDFTRTAFSMGSCPAEVLERLRCRLLRDVAGRLTCELGAVCYKSFRLQFPWQHRTAAGAGLL